MFCKHGQCHVKHIWKQFASEAELVCPQSCFPLKCLLAHCPSFLRPPAGPARGKGSHKPGRGGQQGTLLLLWLGRGSRPAEGPAGSGSLFPKLSGQEAERGASARACVCTAVKSRERDLVASPACLWQPQAKGLCWTRGGAPGMGGKAGYGAQRAGTRPCRGLGLWGPRRAGSAWSPGSRAPVGEKQTPQETRAAAPRGRLVTSSNDSTCPWSFPFTGSGENSLQVWRILQVTSPSRREETAWMRSRQQPLGQAGGSCHPVTREAGPGPRGASAIGNCVRRPASPVRLVLCCLLRVLLPCFFCSAVPTPTRPAHHSTEDAPA